jgi:hypothetical protein
MRKVHLAGIVVIILVLAFYFGDFALVKSESHMNGQVGALKNANATFYTGFCVYPDSPFGKLVAGELMSKGYRVLLLPAPVECDGQFLAVWVEWSNVSYSPVFARGEVRVVAIYSSAGDPSHYLRYRNATDKKRALIEFLNTTEPQVQAYILADISDESVGIISVRGYHNYLLKQAAEVIADGVQDLELEGKREKSSN